VGVLWTLIRGIRASERTYVLPTRALGHSRSWKPLLHDIGPEQSPGMIFPRTPTPRKVSKDVAATRARDTVRPPVASGWRGLAPVRWRAEGTEYGRRSGRTEGRGRNRRFALKRSNGGIFPDTGAHSLVWLEHPADNREVVGSNPTGPIPRQRIAPSERPRLPLGSRKRRF
jgi:hypothetical protein